MGVDRESYNPYVVPNPKSLHVKELLMFRLIFFWFTLNLEDFLMRRDDHKFTNMNHASFFQKAYVTL